MKVLCLVDHLGSGGAQRQFAELARGLAQRGHDVHAFCYFSEPDLFSGPLLSAGVSVRRTNKGAGFSPRVLAELWKRLARESFDVMIAFLEGPAAYAELAGLGWLRVPIVVSERAGQEGAPAGMRAYATRLLHLRAARVVTNTRAHADWLRRHFPWLRGRTACIYNGVAPHYFVEGWEPPPARDQLRLLGVGRIAAQKNIDGLIRGLAQLEARSGWMPHVHWAGRVDEHAYAASLDRLLEAHPSVRRRWQFLGEAGSVADLLPRYHAVVLPSRFEGLPNALCEAFAAGLPALASNVADHAVLVGGSARGTLFEPDRPADIAEAIDRIASRSTEQWRAMSQSAICFAAGVLDMDRMVSAYEDLLLGVARGDRRVSAALPGATARK